ncbi:MAG: GyrI-like domain-containing protein [Eubacteriaceae bacterium]|nr:GyrI-like domain-containing protein [Eubacteriaceae bacterium]
MKFEIVENTDQLVLCIRTKTTIQALPRIIGQNYMKIVEYMTQVGENPMEAPYTAYYSFDKENVDVEMGFPVKKAYEGSGEIISSILPGGQYLTFLFKGPYNEMAPVYEEMEQWIKDNGYQKPHAYYEYYYNSPQDVPVSELLTKIAMPLKK